MGKGVKFFFTDDDEENAAARTSICLPTAAFIASHPLMATDMVMLLVDPREKEICGLLVACPDVVRSQRTHLSYATR